MSATCDRCRNRIRGEGHRTTTRLLCDSCFDEFQGAAGGFLAGGTVGSAISTAGWHTAIKRKKK